jgi:hypothetical protein
MVVPWCRAMMNWLFWLMGVRQSIKYFLANLLNSSNSESIHCWSFPNSTAMMAATSGAIDIAAPASSNNILILLDKKSSTFWAISSLTAHTTCAAAARRCSPPTARPWPSTSATRYTSICGRRCTMLVCCLWTPGARSWTSSPG